MIDQIGCDWFSGISSDSTGNTQLACEIVVKEIPTIIILPNPCHHMNNTAKNIGGLDYWNEVHNNLILVYWFLVKLYYVFQCLSNLCALLNHFKKSSFAKTHLTALHVHMDIKCGLVSIGNTRFLTYYYAASSALDSFDAIEQLVNQKIITTKKACIHFCTGWVMLY